jgi:hypothetical protein
MTLDEYFHAINKPQKLKHEDEGVNMFFQKAKEYAQSLKDYWTVLYAWEEPNPEHEVTDFYSFEMHTASWYDSDEGREVPAKSSFVFGDHVGDEDPTWSTVLDKILDEMNKHYGYDVKSQVYYVVDFPTNDLYPNKRGRMLNAEVLDQVSLAFPEIFERNPKWNEPKNIFA